MSVFIGVDVGTGSARAGVFDTAGRMLASHKHDIAMWRAPGGIFEQSSDDIWAAVCTSVRAAVAAADCGAEAVAGIGFDAACSMVVLDGEMAPLGVGSSGDDARNVIVWMDQRATDQAARINRTGHPVLTYVGGRISPEMQTPKLLWLKENKPETFAQAGQFFDLPDFLTWSATGSLTRSTCTVTCKWTYLAHEDRWDDTYFDAIGLPEIAAENYARIGQTVRPAGTALDSGLSDKAARAMGLRRGTPVAAGLIDAHAGGVGTVGAAAGGGPEATMAYVFGTSACTMSSASQAHEVPGVWGPYFSVMVPGMWLSEGGQSAAGEAIAHLISRHPQGIAASDAAREAGVSVQEYLLGEVQRRAPDTSEADLLAGRRIIVPDFLGNRAPHADPAATGIMSGMTLECDFDDLVGTYVAAILGVGYGLRQILEVQAAHGVAPRNVVISGGAGQSPIIKQLLADASGLSVLAPASEEPVLLGAAMLGAVASGHFPDLHKAMHQMSHIQGSYAPSTGRPEERHNARYTAFKAMQNADRSLRKNLDAIG